MKVHNKITLLIPLILFSSIAMANTSKGNKKFYQKDYIGAIEEYKKTAENSKDETAIAFAKYKIGECHTLINEPKEVVSYIGEAITSGYNVPEAYLLYGKNLQKMGEYKRAKAAFEEYGRLMPKDLRVKNLKASCDFAIQHASKNPISPEESLSALNTSEIEFGIGFYQDGIIYASTEKTDKGFSSKMYFANEKNNFTTSRPADMIKTKRGENTGTFTIDTINNLMFYTRCISDEDDNCFVYSAKYKSEKWKDKGILNIGNRHTNASHPALSPDKNRLYFTSSMKGGYGGSDIWYVEKQANGKWGKPVNAGSVVNTAGNEAFPYVIGNVLIFASDGHIGFGGYDIYRAQIEDNTIHMVQNLMKPINSSFDDINLIVSQENNEAFLVSSRNTETKDDIYRFEGIFSSMMVSGHAYNKTTEEPIPNTQIILNGMGKTQTVKTNEEGYYYAFIEAGDFYKIIASSAGYLSDIAMIKTEKSTIGNFPVEQDFYLTPTGMSISGRVYDMETDEPFINEDVMLVEGGTVIQQTKTDITGRYTFTDLTNGKEYQVKVNKPNFLSITSKPFRYEDGNSSNSSLDLASISYGNNKNDANNAGSNNNAGNNNAGNNNGLGANNINNNLNSDKYLNREISLKEIYYDFDNANLLPESKYTLDKIVMLLSSNPTIKLEFGSHTDSRGTVEYNQQLSDARAKSVVDYLIGSGIGRNRLSWKGYGKSNPVVKHAVTEEEHRLNRRTTFKIIER